MPSILIVDDDTAIRNILKAYLSDAGYLCMTAEEVHGAKNLLNFKSVDLVLSDINMPGESGIQLARYIKKEHPETAIIMVSVIDNPVEAKEVLDLGVYGYIVKPFTRNTVLISVDNALRRRGLEIQQKAYQQELEATVLQQTAKLQSQVVFLQTLTDTIPSPIFYKSQKGVLLGCNKAFEQFFGLKRDQIIGRKMSDLDSQQLYQFDQSTGSLPSAPKQLEQEVSVINIDGKERDILIKRAMYVNEKSRMEGIVGVMLDITERKEMEMELRTSEEKYRQIVDHIGIGVALISPRLEILQMNEQLRKWFPRLSLNEATLCYRSFHTPPKDKPCDNCPTLKTFSQGKVFENTISGTTGSQNRDFRTLSSPIHDEDGNIIAAIILVEDVTDKLALERELRQAQKLEAIGQLAAGIAHEINTPIQYIGDNTGFLKEAFGDMAFAFSAFNDLVSAVKDRTFSETTLREVEARVKEADLPYLQEEIPRAIEQSMDGVQRVSQIVSAMREFSHPGTGQKTPVDLNHALESTITVARNEWKYVAEMHKDFDPSLPEVYCLPGEINQVFLNIIINAAHAINERTNGGNRGLGKIKITTHKGIGSISVRISDTGGGIPESIQHRIFDPFFTTKGVGKGTGQGLAIAHNVVTEKHGGTLRFESSQGKGTTFFIELPLALDEGNDEA